MLKTWYSQQPWIGAVDVWYLQQLDQLTGASTYANNVNVVFTGWYDQLQHGNPQSYDDVQWVSIAFGINGNLDAQRGYYNQASLARDSGFCGGGCMRLSLIACQLLSDESLI